MESPNPIEWSDIVQGFSHVEIKRTLRVLARNLSYSIPAVCALALGIGANTAIYSLVHGVLLRPLPYRDAGQLVQIVRHDGNSEFKVSASDFESLKHESSPWNQIALYQRWSVSFNGSAGPEMLRSADVSPDFFDLFEVPPVLGRLFYSDEGLPGKEPIAVISDSIWRTRFAANPSVVGTQINLGAKSYTIVGIAPADFSFPGTDVWFPLVPRDGLTNRDKEIVARLKSGASLHGAQSAADVVTARLSNQDHRDRNKKLKVISLQEQLNKEVRPLTFLLFATSGFVLLLACTNVSLALISRGMANAGEIAVRQALGAKSWHVVQHVLTESVVIGLVGGAFGSGVAWAGIRLFLAFVRSSQETTGRVEMSHEALAFTLAISLLAGILAGLLPAIASVKQDIGTRLAQIGSYIHPAAGRLRLRDIVLGFQISAALVLLICTSLLLRSLLMLSRVDVGFDFHPAIVMWTAPPQSYGQDQVKLFYQQILEKVKSLPGVSSVGISSNGFFFGTHSSLAVVSGTDPSGARQMIEVRSVSPSLFQAAGMTLIHGHYFDDADSSASSSGKLVVDDTFARRFWPGQDALGKTITIPDKPPTEWQVVGIVKGTRDISLREEPVPTIYWDYRHDPPHSMCVIVRTSFAPRDYARPIREQILAVDSNSPPGPAMTLEELQAGPLKALQVGTLLLGCFAMIALALASVGVYGAVSHTVVQRTHEIGVRVALGANPASILKLVMTHAAKVCLLGTGLGALETFLVTGALSGITSYLSHSDWLSYLTASLVLVATALLAAYIPARKAAQADPLASLRRE